MIDTNVSQGFFATIGDAMKAVGQTSAGSRQTAHTTHTANLDPDRLKPVQPPSDASEYDPPTPEDYS
jgi:hypothetical protein